MAGLIDPIKRFFRKGTFAYKSTFAVMSLQQYLMVNLGAPLMQMLCFTLVANYVYGSQNIITWFIGNAVVLTYFNAIFGVGTHLSAEKSFGTLKLLIASPSNGFSILLPRTLLHIFDGILTIFIGLIVGALFFGFHLPIEAWMSFGAVLLAASFSAMAFGLIIASIGLASRDLNLILNVVSMSLLGLTGANFPINRLPEFIQPLSQMMPLTRSITLCRAIYEGTPLSENTHLLLGEIGLGVIFMIIGTSLFKILTKKSIQSGVLEFF